MARILAVATHATDDPTKASLAFITAVNALGSGAEVAVALLGEAAYLAKPGIAANVHGVGFPPLPELIEKAVQGGIPIYV